MPSSTDREKSFSRLRNQPASPPSAVAARVSPHTTMSLAPSAIDSTLFPPCCHSTASAGCAPSNTPRNRPRHSRRVSACSPSRSRPSCSSTASSFEKSIPVRSSDPTAVDPPSTPPPPTSSGATGSSPMLSTSALTRSHASRAAFESTHLALRNPTSDASIHAPTLRVNTNGGLHKCPSALIPALKRAHSGRMPSPPLAVGSNSITESHAA